ncbi:MAG: nucleotidyl transferase AbiEii/AbiGii toxin family protein [Promethearchaeota archaeon]
MTPKKMRSNVGDSTKAKLKNLAKKRNWQARLIYLAYIFEGFMYRLSMSKYHDKLILKGGTLLYCEKFDIRQTVDIDFLGLGIPNALTDVKTIMQEICKIKNTDFIDFHYNDISIIETQQLNTYGGFKIKIPCSFSTIQEILQIDLGFNDIIVPKERLIEYPLLLENSAIFKIKAYSIESLMAEKLHSVYYLGLLNSRMKDYFDLYKISEKISFEQKILLKAVKSTFEKRNTEIFSSVLLDILNSSTLAKDFQRYCAKKQLQQIDFQSITERINSMFVPIFKLIEDGSAGNERNWNIHAFLWKKISFK